MKAKNEKPKMKIVERFSIDITPDISLYYKMGGSGHNFNQMVAELIDNPIDARTPEQIAGKEVLSINIIVDEKKNSFSITDNGIGMDRETAAKAAILGKSEKTDKNLGSIGVGMKATLHAMSNNFTVETSMKGNDYGTVFEYNHEDWIKSSVWTLPAFNFKKEINKHGTIITVNKVTKITLSPKKIQDLKNDIGKRYSSYIKSGLVKITVNNVVVTVEDINWAEGYPINFQIPCKYGEISGIIGLTKEGNQKGFSGFNLYRNGRMIKTYSKFAIGQHATTARISGEINLDFVKVSNQKNDFIVESPEYEEAETACKESTVFKNILHEARKKSDEGDNKKENAILSKHIQANMPFIAKALNELEYNMPMGAGEGKEIVKTKKGIDIGGIIEKIEREKRGKYKKGEPKPKPKSKKIKNVDLIEINGQKVKIVDGYVFEKNMGRKKTEYEEKDTTLYIYINKAYAGFITTKDKSYYCIETILEGIIEHMFKEHLSLISDINEHKESLLTVYLKYGEYFKDKLELEDEEVSVENVIEE